MNKQDRAKVIELRRRTRGLNRYRFAWYLIAEHPTLVVEIIRQYLKDTENKAARNE